MISHIYSPFLLVLMKLRSIRRNYLTHFPCFSPFFAKRNIKHIEKLWGPIWSLSDRNLASLVSKNFVSFIKMHLLFHKFFLEKSIILYNLYHGILKDFPLHFKDWVWVKIFWIEWRKPSVLKLILPKWQSYNDYISLNQLPTGLYLLPNVISML